MSVDEESEVPKPKGKVEVRVIGGRSAPEHWDDDWEEVRRPNVVRLEPGAGKVSTESDDDWQELEPGQEGSGEAGTGLDPEAMRTITMPEAAPPEIGKSGRRRRRSSRGRKPRKLSKRLVFGTWWMAAMVTVLIVAGVITVVLTRPNDVPDAAPLVMSGPATPEEIAAEEESQRMLALTEQAKSFLLDLARMDADEAVELVAGSESVRHSFLREWKPFRLREDDFSEYQVQAHKRDDRFWATLVGASENGELREWVILDLKDGLKLDWAASAGLGEVPFEELRELSAGETVTMRVVAGRSNFHTSTFPETEWACFRLRDARDEKVIWGYVPEGGEIEAKISTALREDSLLLEPLVEVALMLKLKKPERAARGQFEVVEVVRVGWIED